MQIPKKITLELAEETGWHIGDGSMNFYKNRGKLKGFYQLRGHLEDDKEHYEKRIKPLFEKLYQTKISLRDMPSTRVVGFQIWNDELIKFKQELGLSIGRKINIEIPKVFLTNKELKGAIIRGIFDTDGGVYLEKKNNKIYPRMYITTISRKLAEQILETLKYLGFRTTLYSQIDKRKSKRLTLYFITIRGIQMFYKFIIEINPQNPKFIKKYTIFLNSQNL
jgi:hypothetical protein